MDTHFACAEVRAEVLKPGSKFKPTKFYVEVWSLKGDQI